MPSESIVQEQMYVNTRAWSTTWEAACQDAGSVHLWHGPGRSGFTKRSSLCGLLKKKKKKKQHTLF